MDLADGSSQIETKHEVQSRRFVHDFNELLRGTRKLLVLMPSIVEVLMRDKNLVVDVAEANLHNKVFGALICLFTDKTTN